jgi:DNA-binding XRE family transcriptional regulator
MSEINKVLAPVRLPTDWFSSVQSDIRKLFMTRTARKPQDPNSVAYRLRLSRDIFQLSQSKFAEKAGLKPNRYNQYETGKRALPFVAADLLYKTYGLTPDWFYYGKTYELPTWFTVALRTVAA